MSPGRAFQTDLGTRPFCSRRLAERILGAKQCLSIAPFGLDVSLLLQVYLPLGKGTMLVCKLVAAQTQMGKRALLSLGGQYNKPAKVPFLGEAQDG